MAVNPISSTFGNIGGINSDSSTRALNEATDNSFEEKLKAAIENKDQKELKSACKQFEGIMLEMMYKQMRATVVKSNLVEEDSGMEIFQGMLDDKLMEQASQTSAMGLADALYKQLSRQIDTSSKK
jgi:Rod binding protein